jgi:pyruvate kinase
MLQDGAEACNLSRIVHRLTKIVATLGPASAEESRIEELIAAGVDVFRLNFSHGSHERHAESIARIRRAAGRAGRHIAILQDLSGPKIRTGKLQNGQPLELAPGDRLTIETGDDSVGSAGRVSTTFAELGRAVRPGDRLLLDDGRIELRVESSDGKTVSTIVTNGGPLGEHKGINLPGIELPTSAMTAKDVEDLRFGLEHGVDIVALSFVQTAADVIRARELIAAQGHAGVPVIAKIERPAAVVNLDAILDNCNGVMVARGDMGLEMPLERVPRVQKEITRKARACGKPVIVATQVFDSMTTEPRPTRAEVSDAANAVDDAVDAIMLSGETAVGVFPVKTVQTLDAVIRDAESITPSLLIEPGGHVVDVEHNRALCEAAVTLAESGAAAAIVAVTVKGKTARVLSAFRPGVPIFAVSPNDAVARRLALYRGVTPLTTEVGSSLDATGVLVERDLLSRGLLPAGCVVVFVSVNADLTRGDANFMRIRRLSDT